MQLYVLNGNGIVFEFSEDAGGYVLGTSVEQQVKVAVLLEAALAFLKTSRGGDGGEGGRDREN